jgi:hypothetical protein
VHPALGQTNDAASGLVALAPTAIMLGAWSAIGYFGGRAIGRKVTHSKKRAEKWAVYGAVGAPVTMLALVAVIATQVAGAIGRSKFL